MYQGVALSAPLRARQPQWGCEIFSLWLDRLLKGPDLNWIVDSGTHLPCRSVEKWALQSCQLLSIGMSLGEASQLTRTIL